MPEARWWTSHVILFVVIAAAAVMVFPNLGNRYLWDDEAETALLARSVLRHGIPIAWDGRDLISQECGTDYDANYLWRHTPWLPIYLTAGSFKLFGEGTWSARLPFAVIGLATIASLYVLGLRVFADPAVANLAVVALVASVPFLVHVRQARYYALAMLGAVWLVYFVFAVLAESRGSPIGLAGSFTLLFHSTYLGAAAMLVGLIAALFLLRPRRRALIGFGLAAAIALALNAPWFFLLDLGAKAGVAWTAGNASDVAARALWLLRTSELYAFPSIAVIVALIVWWTRTRLPMRSITCGRCALALAVLVLGHTAVVALTPWQFFRYLVTLLPVWALLLAWAARTVAAGRPLLAIVCLGLALVPDRADLVRGVAGSPIVKYVDDILHDFDGPIEALARHLRAHAAAGDRVFISYGDLPLRFHTTLHVRGGQGCQWPVLTPAPDWIVIRHFFRFANPSPGSADDIRRVLTELRDRTPWSRYQSIPLATVDTVWENIPEPDRRVYRTPVAGPKVALYHTRAPAPPERR